MRVERIGNATLYCADFDVIADELPACDAVISDPQYAPIDNDSTRLSGGNMPRGAGRSDWQVNQPEAFDPRTFLRAPIVSLWGYHHFADKLPTGTILIWDKRSTGSEGTFLSDAELAWLNVGHGVYIHRLPHGPLVTMPENTAGNGNAHPHQKPIALIEWQMMRAKVPGGATVLDPHMGSGTTGVACARTGRAFVGVEVVESFFDTACQRIDHAQRQLRLFA